MTFDDSVFQLSAPWYDLGVVTPTRLEALRTEWARGEDRNSEHYRWRAFTEFLAERRPLSAELAAALYALGEADPDHAIGQAMMHRIVELPECPPALIEAAYASNRGALTRFAQRRLAARPAKLDGTP